MVSYHEGVGAAKPQANKKDQAFTIENLGLLRAFVVKFSALSLVAAPPR
jgi:hypothetical protein